MANRITETLQPQILKQGSQVMELLVVTYHYLGKDPHPFEAVYPISEKQFEDQLDMIGDEFTFVGVNDVISAVQGDKALPKRSCLVTFDDGLKCQYEIGWSTLKRKGIPGLFFVNTEPLVDRHATLTHKIHWLRGHLPPGDFKQRVSDSLHQMGISLAQFETVELKVLAAKQYPYDMQEVACLKYILNFKLGWSDLERMINAIFAEYFDSDGDFCDHYYFGEGECRILASENAIGCHGHRHSPLSRLTVEDFKYELTHSLEYLRNLTDKPIQSISYPFGGFSLESHMIHSIVKGLGLLVGFINKKQINRSLQNNLFLGRYNTNDIPGGSKPIITFERDEI